MSNPAAPTTTAPTTTAQTTTDVLITLISAFLAPMFLVSADGDIALARMAALHTMNAYRIQHQADLIAVAQIVAFGFAALGSLSLSMADGISIPMMLRLRGNANACNRSAEQNRRALQASHQASPVPYAHPPEAPPPPVAKPPMAEASPRPPEAHAAMPAQQPAAPVPVPMTPVPMTPVPMTADQRHRAMWAAAFTEVANEYAAELPNLPPEEQRAATICADALASSAHALLSGADLSAYALKPLEQN